MSSSFPWLTALIAVPVLGAVLLWALPAGLRKHTRSVALAVALLVLALGVGALAAFDPSAVDMLSLLIVGARRTRLVARPNGRSLVYTPRGYGALPAASP